MRLFVMCAGRSLYSGRLLAYQLKARLKDEVEVHYGSAEDLHDSRCREVVYDYVLNTGAVEKFVSGCRVLNDVHLSLVAKNRMVCLMKLRTRHIPVPEFKIKPMSITEDMLPMIGRASRAGNPRDFWTCFTMEQVAQAARQGANHFVKRIADSREFRVHVVAPRVDIHKSDASEYQVIKVSERRTACKLNKELNPANKKQYPRYYFGQVLEGDEQLVEAVRSTAQRAIKELMLHWGAVSIIVGRDGVPLVIKIDTHVDTKEDQTNTVAKLSNAICKMLGKEPKPLVRRRPIYHA